MIIIRFTDNLLNKITMYRLMVYGLSILVFGAVILCLTGELPLSAVGILLSLIVLLFTCYISNRSFAILFENSSNTESWLITALILCLILPPSKSMHQLGLIGIAGVIAMGSKYLIAYKRKHIFNPAAAAAVILGLSNLLPAIWWVGSPAMLPLTAVFGLLVLRKIRRFQLFISFILASAVTAVYVGSRHNESLSYTLSTLIKSSPLIYLGAVMLTEPETSPSRIWSARLFGAAVGAIFSSQLRVGSISATPEMALVVGNLFCYLSSPRYRLLLHLKSKIQIAPNIWDFTFLSEREVNFLPGQYMEWTLPDVRQDSRGNRRTFSIASAPGQNELHIAIKSSNPGSNYKKSLVDLNLGDSIFASRLEGDFLLPKDQNVKLMFIAGGIGITPYISMVQDMIKRRQQRDIVLFYMVADPLEFCYQDVWAEARPYGLKVIPVLGSDKVDNNWRSLTGRLNEEVVRRSVPDFPERRFYLSGPPALVDNYRLLLLGLGIKRTQIITDHFTGY